MSEFIDEFSSHTFNNKLNDINNKYFKPKHKGIDAATLGSMI